MAIHPTAVIHPKAEIGEGCEIGPFCVIEEHVVLGPGNRLHSHVVIGGHTRVGRENDIYPFASIGLKTQDLKWKGGVTRTEVGDFNTIRENVTIHSATSDGEATIIGSHNNLLANTHIGHNCVLANHIIISVAGIAGHVVIEDRALVGGMSGVHQFCRIGTMAMVGGLSKVTQDVLPYMLVDGNPAECRAINKVGLDRNGVADKVQQTLRHAQRLLCREGLTLPNALQRIEQELSPSPELAHLVAFVRSSERGITK